MKLWMLWVAVAVIGVLLMMLRARGNVSGPEARRLVAAGARLIDVRTPDEFTAGHLDGAINVPVDELAGKVQTLGSKDQPIVVYCASGTRSAMAASTLERAGFLHVHNLGAKSRW